MHHDMFDGGKLLLNAVVDTLGSGVGLHQRKLTVETDLQIHIDAVSKLAGL